MNFRALKLLVAALAFLIIAISCDEKVPMNVGGKISLPEVLEPYLVNDSVVSGLAMECQPLRIPSDSVLSPTIKTIGETAEMLFHTNTVKLTNLESYPYVDSVFPIPDTLEPKPGVFTIDKPKKNTSVIAQPMKFMESALYDLQYLDIDEGLNSSHLWDILQDKRGHIWFASHNAGVCKYDGSTFVNYTKADGLCDNSIRDIFEDSKGNLWFASKGEGVTKYDGINFTTYCNEEIMGTTMINETFEDSKGNIWFAMEGGGLTKLNEDGFLNYAPELGISHSIVRTIAELDNGALLLGTWSKGLTLFDGENFRQIKDENGLQKGHIRKLYKDTDGHIWIAIYGGGVLKFDGERFTKIMVKDGLPHQTVNCITQDGNGRMWFGTKLGLAVLEDSVLTTFTDKNGLRNLGIRTLMTDDKGNVWAGTWGGGALQFKINSFHHYTGKNGLHTRLISSITEWDEKLWFSSHQAGVLSYDGKVGAAINSESGLPQNIVMCSFKDSKNNLWFGTMSGGVTKFDGESFTTYSKKNGLSAFGVFSINEDLDGNILLGINGGGLNIFDGKEFHHLTDEQGLSNNIVRAIEVDNNGAIWVGTWSEGLCKFAGDEITFISSNEGLSSKHIYCVEKDANGLIYVGSDEGLDILDPNDPIEPNKIIFEHIGTESGLTNNNVMAISFDKDNNAWISTKKGLNKMKSFRPGTQDIEIRQYLKNDGLLSTDLLINSSCVDSKNRLWIGSGRSAAMLDLNLASADIDKPLINLTNLEIGGKFIDFNSDLSTKEYTFQGTTPFSNYPTDLELDYDNDHLVFHFSGTNWNLNSSMKYRYRLNDDWGPIETTNKAEYRNLSHGTYTFEVQACTNEKNWSETAEFKFVIHPPWWHTWWARTLFVVISILLLYGIYKRKTRKLKQRQVELETTVEERTSELRDEKKAVELQKEIVEEKNTEILDSITYAKRIQSAILPPAKLVKEYLADSFILYKPKDIVAGDFYWMEQKEGKTLFAAADCTGHGVPGALVSVICNNGLNRSVREYGLIKPGEILDKTREIVIGEFEKSDEEVRDGMDIALCSIDGNKVEYAGANNPLWLIRNGELIELKGDKQPIGKYDAVTPFTTYELELEKEDTIYIFSDGYSDQFGGEKGKKLKSSNFKKLLISIQNKSMEEQKNFLDNSFESWRGDLEQLDDVCVIGVRI